MTRKSSKVDSFKQLTWDDLHEWAGSRVFSRGQGYQRSHRVQELAQTQTEGLIAWVQGEHRYATRVTLEDGELTSTCTCPYRACCKHAVAVVLEYLDRLKKNLEIPKVTEKDKRLVLLDESADEDSCDCEVSDLDEDLMGKPDAEVFCMLDL